MATTERRCLVAVLKDIPDGVTEEQIITAIESYQASITIHDLRIYTEYQPDDHNDGEIVHEFHPSSKVREDVWKKGVRLRV